MTKPKMVIKINDKMVEFDLSDSNSHSFRVLTDDEAAEHFMLLKPDGSNADPHLEAELGLMIQDVTDKMKESFKASLQNTVLSMLGFSNRWSGGWEVDTTNGSKFTTVSQFINDEMKNFIAKEVIDPAKIISPKEIDVMVKAAKKKFMESYDYNLRQHIHFEMERQMKDMIGKMVAEMLSHQELEIKKTVASLVARPRVKGR